MNLRRKRNEVDDMLRESEPPFKIHSAQGLTEQDPGPSSIAGKAAGPTRGKKTKEVTFIYYRNFGKNDTDNWSGSLSKPSDGKLGMASFTHSDMDDSHQNEQTLQVKALHVKKQIGDQTEGHTSIFVECASEKPLMIKMDLVRKGYRVYVDAKPDSGYETETFDIAKDYKGKLTVKEIYGVMAKVATDLGGWATDEEHNCRGFVTAMMKDLNPKLSAPRSLPPRSRQPRTRYGTDRKE
jgi:hypothetical protein